MTRVGPAGSTPGPGIPTPSRQGYREPWSLKTSRLSGGTAEKNRRTVLDIVRPTRLSEMNCLALRQLHRPDVDRRGVRRRRGGKLAAEEAAELDRAVGRLTNIGWGIRLHELFASTVDEPVPDDLVDTCVKVLAAWDWTQRPVGVVVVGSSRRPRLVSSIGERIAAIGRLSWWGRLSSQPDSDPRMNSAHRLAQVWQSLAGTPDLAERLSTVDGPVLLVDDQVNTGWTLALTAKLLRDAGASAVLPFALAVTT